MGEGILSLSRQNGWTLNFYAKNIIHRICGVIGASLVIAGSVIRIEGWPGQTFSTNHGRLGKLKLILKIVFVRMFCLILWATRLAFGSIFISNFTSEIYIFDHKQQQRFNIYLFSLKNLNNVVRWRIIIYRRAHKEWIKRNTVITGFKPSKKIPINTDVVQFFAGFDPSYGCVMFNPLVLGHPVDSYIAISILYRMYIVIIVGVIQSVIASIFFQVGSPSY